MNILGQTLFRAFEHLHLSNLKLTIFLWSLDYFRGVKYRLDISYVLKRKYFAYENNYDLK